jgi:hypothetical protein
MDLDPPWTSEPSDGDEDRQDVDDWSRDSTPRAAQTSLPLSDLANNPWSNTEDPSDPTAMDAKEDPPLTSTSTETAEKCPVRYDLSEKVRVVRADSGSAQEFVDGKTKFTKMAEKLKVSSSCFTNVDC